MALGNGAFPSPNMLPSTADIFSTGTAYNVGDYVWYQGQLYKFKSAHAAGSWRAGDVDKAKLANDVRDLRNATNIPAPPSSDGTYTLKVTVASGVATYAWTADT